MGIREPRMPTDHLMVLENLIGEGVKRYHSYCKERTIWPITEAKGGKVQEGDSQFSNLNNMVKKPSRKTRTAASWISDAT